MIRLFFFFIFWGCNFNPTKHQNFQYKPVPHISDVKHKIYLRTVIINENFLGSRIPVFKHNGIIFEDDLGTEMRSLLINAIEYSAAIKNIEITKFNDKNYLDCIIDEIFYDENKKSCIVKYTLNFKGKKQSFIINENISKDEFEEIFTRIGENIVEYIVKTLEAKQPSFNKS